MTSKHPTINQMVKQPLIYTDERAEKIWNYYHGLGRASSHEKLLEFVKQEGMYNHQLGRPSRMGPWRAMWAWAYNHPKEAYPAWQAWANENKSTFMTLGIPINFDSFLIEVKNVVKKNSIYRESKVRVWCQEWKVDYNKEFVMQTA